MPDSPVEVPVHIEGMVSKSPVAVVEDACQAFGAKGVGYSGTACYSFYPAKIFGGPGDGGAIVTNDKDMYDYAKLYRHHYQTGVDEVYGWNSRLDNIMAGFLNVKLKYIPDILKRREEIAKKYSVALKGYVGLPHEQEGRVWQDYVVTSDDREALVAHLKANGVGILGDNMTPNYIATNCTGELPETKKLYQTMFRLPLNETLTDEDVEYVIDTVKKFYV
jgi:dTDP-4-amino-4,6-dideoxygalactose transaminase